MCFRLLACWGLLSSGKITPTRLFQGCDQNLLFDNCGGHRHPDKWELVRSPVVLGVSAVIFMLRLYQHPRSPIVTRILVSINSRSDSTLMFISSSGAFSSGCSAFYQDLCFVRSTSWIFACPFTTIWHCSHMLLWLLGHRRLHRSAWKSFKQVFGRECSSCLLI